MPQTVNPAAKLQPCCGTHAVEFKTSKLTGLGFRVFFGFIGFRVYRI